MPQIDYKGLKAELEQVSLLKFKMPAGRKTKYSTYHERMLDRLAAHCITAQNAMLQGTTTFVKEVFDAMDSIIDRRYGKARQSLELTTDDELASFLRGYSRVPGAIIEPETKELGEIKVVDDGSDGQDTA